MAKILGVDHLTFVVRDLESTLSFVEKVLGGKYLFELRRENSVTALCEIGDKLFGFASPIGDEGFFAQF